MKSLFLRAKHWQIFLFSFGLPMLCTAMIMPGAIEFFGNLILFTVPLMFITYVGTLLGWYWSIGVGLAPGLPRAVLMRVARFKILFWIVMGYLISLAIGFASGFIFYLLKIELNDNVLYLLMFAYVLPMHLISMFCMLHTLWFDAKLLKSVELGRLAHFNDYAGEFFLFWFFFIGVWVIQPRVNDIYRQMERNPRPEA